jgi:thiol-disulfide isomerase/thioredoxin
MHHSRFLSRRGWGIAALGLALLVGGIRWGTFHQASDRVALPREGFHPIAYQPKQQAVPHLNLEGGQAWLNTAGPIHAQALRGKIVLLDFWTLCCINCHHVLPDLTKLEQKYKNGLVVIGIHTGKFPEEKITANIKQKVREYGIKHPVVNDADQKIWLRFGVQSWPTLAVFDTKGAFVGAVSGEGQGDILDKAIGKLIAQAKSKGELDETPVDFHLEDEKVDANTPLRFPGKVLADSAGGRLFISDTGHNRIVITDLKGATTDVIGSGTTGLKNGSYEHAQFNRQQGMCLLDEVLYVADVENHAIRAVDLKAKTVETIAGDGTQTHARKGSFSAKAAHLNSPWDLVAIPGTKTLLIAMAGPHQIWSLDLEKKLVTVWAGNGSEDIVDGSLDSASFAQPSGLATDGKNLFVADSEGSCVRSISLGADHTVSTLLGAHDVAGVLFSWGDVDSTGSRVRLQHCLGLAYADGKLYIADTYNNKVKICDVTTRAAKTLAGLPQYGNSDDPAKFYQPGGLSVAGDTLYVADSNNDAIREVDLKSGKVSTLEIANLKAPAPPRERPKFPRAKEIKASEVKVAPGQELTLDVTLAPPKGFKLNEQQAMPYVIETPGQSELLSQELEEAGGKIKKPSSKFSIKVPLSHPVKPGDHFNLSLSLTTFVCKQGSEGLCKLESYVWTVPVLIADGASPNVALTNAR